VPRSQQYIEPNKCIFMICLNTENVRSGCHSVGGRSFHNRGPAAVKLLSPNRLCVYVMSLEPERSGRRMTSDSRRQSSVRYAGAAPVNDWGTNPPILKIILLRTSRAASAAAVAAALEHVYQEQMYFYTKHYLATLLTHHA